MKKIILIITMLFLLSGCGKTNSSDRPATYAKDTHQETCGQFTFQISDDWILSSKGTLRKQYKLPANSLMTVSIKDNEYKNVDDIDNMYQNDPLYENIQNYESIKTENSLRASFKMSVSDKWAWRYVIYKFQNKECFQMTIIDDSGDGILPEETFDLVWDSVQFDPDIVVPLPPSYESTRSYLDYYFGSESELMNDCEFIFLDSWIVPIPIDWVRSEDNDSLIYYIPSGGVIGILITDYDDQYWSEEYFENAEFTYASDFVDYERSYLRISSDKSSLSGFGVFYGELRSFEIEQIRQGNHMISILANYPLSNYDVDNALFDITMYSRFSEK